MTKRENFEKLLVLAKEDKELSEFISAEIKALENKSANKKMTKTQEENEKLKEQILDAFKGFTSGKRIKDLVQVAEFNSYSNQKLSALCNQLVEVGELEKETIKRETFFAYVKAEDDEDADTDEVVGMTIPVVEEENTEEEEILEIEVTE